MNEWEWNLLENKTPLDCVEADGVAVRPGDRVRLVPRSGGDIFDLALAGQSATVEALEQDYEGKQHVCVVLDDDPGRDLGLLRQPGHRFFFDPSEIRRLPEQEQQNAQAAPKPGILIAGIGNIFLGDDGFGVEVVKRLAQCGLPKEVQIADFGIRGFDLMFALQDGYESTILIDAFPHGQQPGTVSVIEPDWNDPASASSLGGNFVEPHSMNPLNVLRMAAAMQAPLKRVLLVGCEPGTLGGQEGHIGLSEPVEAAVDAAVQATRNLVRRLLGEAPV